MSSAVAPSLVFAGTPEFAATSLQALLDRGYRPLAVYTQPDRPAGRGRQPRPSAVKQLAQAANIPVRQPTGFRDPETLNRLSELDPELLIVAAYGLLLPRTVLDLPRLGCVNVHASLLPRWRGAAPIQRALLSGDQITGISLMRMDAGLDTGPVLAQARCPIDPGMTGGELHDRLADLGAQTLCARLPAILDGTLRAEPQDNGLATHAPKIDKSEAEIDWQRPAAELARAVNAFNPWPVAWTRLQDRTLRIWRARAEEGSGPPGQTIAEDGAGPLVATGSGTLRLLELQLPGGRPQSGTAFINGHTLMDRRLGRT